MRSMSGASVHPRSDLEVKPAIRSLPREERAMLRPRLLACFDVRGYEERRVTQFK
jgi:hypothetical protein